MQQQNRDQMHQRPTRQSQQRISPHQQQQAPQPKPKKQPAQGQEDEQEIQEKLKAMLTQVHRGESAPRVTGAYPQALKPSGCATPTASGQQAAHHGRNNNRYQSSSVNNPQNNRMNNAQYSGGAPRRQQEVVFRRSQRPHGLLGPQPERFHGLKTLVLDLDETLVHSQFNLVGQPDYTIPVDIEGRISNIYVMKRPGAEYFLQEMAKHFEVCIFTASLSKYADPLMNMMDPQGHSTVRLFREHCTFVNGIFVKDMSQIGRNMKDAIIIDNSPTAYMLQPECGLPILSWYDDPNDRALYDYIPLLIEMSKISDMRDAVTGFVRNNTFPVAHAMSVVAHIREKDTAEAHKRLELERARKQYLMQQMQANQVNGQNAASKADRQQTTSHHIEERGTNHLEQPSSLQQQTEQQPSATSTSSVSQKKQPLINSWFSSQQAQANKLQQRAPSNGLMITTDQQAKTPPAAEHEDGQSLTGNNQTSTNLPPALTTPGSIGSGPGTGKSKRVTNITNIIYNFNYGTNQATGTPQAAITAPSASKSRSSPKNNIRTDESASPGRNSSRSSNSSVRDDQANNSSKLVIAKSKVVSVIKTQAQQLSQQQQVQQSSHHKRRPNTGSATHHQHQALQRQSLKNVVQQVQGQTPNPGSAAILKSKNQRGHSEQQAANAQQIQQMQQQNQQQQQQIAVQMSRKSTIDIKDSHTGKMLVVLDNSKTNSSHLNVQSNNQQQQQRGSSQKVGKQDILGGFVQGQVNTSYVGGKTQLQKQVLQQHVAVNAPGVQNNVKNHLKSKLKQRGDNPFTTQGGPKVLPIEISGNQTTHHHPRGQPQLFVNSSSNKTPQSALLPGPQTTTNAGLKIQKNQFLMMKQDIVGGGSNRNGGGMIKAFTPSAGDQPSSSIFNFSGQSPTHHQPISATVKNPRQSQHRVGQQNDNTTSNNGAKSTTSGTVRSFSQNQGSRKAISNILVYNQGQSMAITSNRNKQSSVLNHHPRTPSVQINPHGQQQSQILYQNESNTLTNGSPKTTANSNIMLEKGSNHSVLVEKYSNFFNQNGSSQATKSAKGGQSTPTSGPTPSDLTLLRGANAQQHQSAHHQRTTSQQMINKLRNSQNQALNATNSAKPQIPRNLLVIPQNAVVQASSQHQHVVYTALHGSKGGSSRGFASKNASGSGISGTQTTSNANSSRNQRLIMMNNSHSGPAAPPQMLTTKSETPKGSSQEHVPSLLSKGEGVQIILPPSSNPQLSFQIGNPNSNNIGVFPKSTTAHGKTTSPKNSFGYAPKHQSANPFKQSSAGNPVSTNVGQMQTHAQFVNQPHHLQAASQGLSQIMAASAAVDNQQDVMGLNLHSLYPQSQSPMSFKQMQSAKRQKRANILAANHQNLQQTTTTSQSRQSNNGSHLANQTNQQQQQHGKSASNPANLQHFYQHQQQQ